MYNYIVNPNLATTVLWVIPSEKNCPVVFLPANACVRHWAHMCALFSVVCMLCGLVDTHHWYNIHINAVFVSLGWNVPAVISWSRVLLPADGMQFCTRRLPSYSILPPLCAAMSIHARITSCPLYVLGLIWPTQFIQYTWDAISWFWVPPRWDATLGPAPVVFHDTLPPIVCGNARILCCVCSVAHMTHTTDTIYI